MTRITLREVTERIKDELVNAQAEGVSYEACREIIRSVEQDYHGDPWISSARVMVSPGRWAYIGLRGNGGGEFVCELLKYEEFETGSVSSLEPVVELGAQRKTTDPQPEPTASSVPGVWQPIETAPKDGTTVIGYTVRMPERWIRVGLGNYMDGQWDWHNDSGWSSATHWTPLHPLPPSPPSETTKSLVRATPTEADRESDQRGVDGGNS